MSQQEERCNGRCPVLQQRDEPFEVTYRCALKMGHAGPCGFEPRVVEAAERPRNVEQELRAQIASLTGETERLQQELTAQREAITALIEGGYVQHQANDAMYLSWNLTISWPNDIHT